jgi:hypothetical protein
MADSAGGSALVVWLTKEKFEAKLFTTPQRARSRTQILLRALCVFVVMEIQTGEAAEILGLRGGRSKAER